MSLFEIVLQAGCAVATLWVLFLPLFIYRTFKTMCQEHFARMKKRVRPVSPFLAKSRLWRVREAK